MNAKKFAVAIRKMDRQANNGAMKENDQRLRVTADCRAKGDNVVEIATTYYFRSQSGHSGAIETIEFCAAELGWNVTLTPITEMHYNEKPWPKDSWASKLYSVAVEPK